MGLDFAQLTAAFSGVQLCVVVFVLMELKSLNASNVRLSAKVDVQDAHISKITSRLAHIAGRLNVKEDD